ncbi:hypothetical protein SmphiM12_125 [Sinorhizobium phage phiM12]|uniref:Uncharacterized protein n=1 Tax=Sinorhizobium phage phiM12 TaxID=1357423 RepID=S5MV54_9CAUD|nr:hypothetical protein AB690_gp098 [Sinorhizobium phage phiM12]AGR47757.1 hypothetical protein SmphiM12_125 [Sinorhizobium phage phiM12]
MPNCRTIVFQIIGTIANDLNITFGSTGCGVIPTHNETTTSITINPPGKNAIHFQTKFCRRGMVYCEHTADFGIRSERLTSHGRRKTCVVQCTRGKISCRAGSRNRSKTKVCACASRRIRASTAIINRKRDCGVKSDTTGDHQRCKDTIVATYNFIGVNGNVDTGIQSNLKCVVGGCWGDVARRCQSDRSRRNFARERLTRHRRRQPSIRKRTGEVSRVQIVRTVLTFEKIGIKTGAVAVIALVIDRLPIATRTDRKGANVRVVKTSKTNDAGTRGRARVGGTSLNVQLTARYDHPPNSIGVGFFQLIMGSRAGLVHHRSKCRRVHRRDVCRRKLIRCVTERICVAGRNDVTRHLSGDRQGIGCRIADGRVAVKERDLLNSEEFGDGRVDRKCLIGCQRGNTLNHQIASNKDVFSDIQRVGADVVGNRQIAVDRQICIDRDRVRSQRRDRRRIRSQCRHCAGFYRSSVSRQGPNIGGRNGCRVRCERVGRQRCDRCRIRSQGVVDNRCDRCRVRSQCSDVRRVRIQCVDVGGCKHRKVICLRSVSKQIARVGVRHEDVRVSCGIRAQTYRCVCLRIGVGRNDHCRGNTHGAAAKFRSNKHASRQHTFDVCVAGCRGPIGGIGLRNRSRCNNSRTHVRNDSVHLVNKRGKGIAIYFNICADVRRFGHLLINSC